MSNKRSNAAAVARGLLLPAALSTALPLAAQDAREREREEVTILGSRQDLQRIAGSAHRIGEATLEEFEYDDINRVMNLVPGVYVREEDGYGLRPNIGLRGGSSDRSQKVTLLEDGVPIAPAPYAAPAAYFFPLTTRMTGVEVFKGPSAIQHGPQTIGGAVNLISAGVPERTRASIEAAAGSDGYGRVHARGGTRWSDGGLLAEFVHLGSDGFKQLDGGGDTGFDKNELMLKGTYELGPGTLRMRFGYADEVSNETYLGLTEADFRADPVRRYRASANDRMEWDWAGARLGWDQPAFGGDLELTAYAHGFEREWNKFNNFRSADVRNVLDAPDTPRNSVLYATLTGARDSDPNTSADDLLIGANAREFTVIGLQGSQLWDFTTGAGGGVEHTLEVGARLHNDRVRRLHDEYAYEMIAGQLERKPSTFAITADNTGTAGATAVWARDEISFGPWTVVPGVRFESISTTFVDRRANLAQDNDYSEALPGVGTSYAVTDNLTLLGGVHKGFSPATPGRDPNVEPEEAINWEGGVRWNAARDNVEGIFFYSDYSNLTSECTFSAGCSGADLGEQINAGEVEIYGLEASWNHDRRLTPDLRLPLAVTYTYTESEILESFASVNPQFGDVEPGDELPYVPEHRANVTVGLEAARWRAELSATYQSRMRNEAGSGRIDPAEGTDAFTVVDVAAHYELLPGLEISGRIDNALDEVYLASRRPFGARPGLPLNFQLSATYRYGN